MRKPSKLTGGRIAKAQKHIEANEKRMKPLKIVMDTNIVMDMLHFNNRHTTALKTAVQKGLVTCYSDTECMAELERVTGYPEFGLDQPGRDVLMLNYRSFVVLCESQADENYLLPRCRDADDQKFLILAARCQADMLLTRDKLLLRLARHRHKPPPFAILTAEAACPQLLQLASEHPTPIF